MIRELTAGLSIASEQGARFADPTMAVAERSVASGGGLAQIFFSLLVVLAAIFVVAWVVRRMKVTPQSRVGHLKVIDEVVLGNKERAVVLEVTTAFEPPAAVALSWAVEDARPPTAREHQNEGFRILSCTVPRAERIEIDVTIAPEPRIPGESPAK